MSKSKPPSHRPERKLDETAKAIARARESVSVSDKASEPKPATDAAPKRSLFHGGKGGGRPAATGGPAPSPSTKRPKQPGG